MVFDGVDLSIVVGECYVLIGLNGVGKLMLFGVIVGVMWLMCGCVVLYGVELCGCGLVVVSCFGIGCSF